MKFLLWQKSGIQHRIIMDILLRKYEKAIIVSLIVLLMVVIFLSTVDLGWVIIQEILTPPILLLDINELLHIFGYFLLILIGVELLDTIKAYLLEHVIHVEVVLEVALIAVARKVVIVDLKELPSSTLIAIASLVAALAVAYYLEKLGRKQVHVIENEEKGFNLGFN